MVNPINPKASSSPILAIISFRVEPVSFIKNWIIISLEILSLLFRLIIFPPKIQKRTNGFSVSSIFSIYLKTLDTYKGVLGFIFIAREVEKEGKGASETVLAADCDFSTQLMGQFTRNRKP